jgi:hypothetical protein
MELESSGELAEWLSGKSTAEQAQGLELKPQYHTHTYHTHTHTDDM